MVRFVALASVALASSGISAATPRAPTGPWALDFAEAQCLATRTYGTTTDMLTLALKPSPNGDLFELVVLNTAYGTRYADEVAATVQVGDRPATPVKLLIYKPRKDGPRLARTRLPAGAAADLRSARSISIKAGRRLDTTLTLSGMPSLMEKMENCLSSLQDHWNISPSREAALRSPAQGDLRNVFRPEDYPDEAIDGNAEGTVQARLLIDDSGKVADCTLTQTSGNALLDVQSCALIMQRARYKPAVGVDGKPAKHTAAGRITWRVEN